MAQFTAQGRLRLLLNGDGGSFGVETRDPFHYKFRTLRSIQAHRRRLRFLKSATRFYSSFSEKKSRLFNVEASINVSDAGIHDESELPPPQGLWMCLYLDTSVWPCDGWPSVFYEICTGAASVMWFWTYFQVWSPEGRLTFVADVWADNKFLGVQADLQSVFFVSLVYM
ncbi:hypothetical protein Patl1_32263 [Pistacia atlantica]|uniref:Uncharacterized protein n=1 Tax=Pistacia atlantica TaxID=434234 RepID=A0ACC1AMU9_9ROSI|nr:hypothetical protein Patl1_32263 [Pistacia atlantica]